jgi:hypothetical protein
MGHLIEPNSQSPQFLSVRNRPGSVRKLDAVATSRGTLLLRWRPPTGVCVGGYLVDRTREGQDYEPLGETNELEYRIRETPPGEPWFYRVRAFNTRGVGGFRLVFFFRRSDRFIHGGHNHKEMLMAVVARPGLRVTISEWSRS